MLEQLEKQSAVGGLGCEHCMYWQEHGVINKELYGFVGRWGRCSNLKTTHDLNSKHLRNNTSTKDRTSTHILRLGVDTQVLSTTPVYVCSNMKVPKTSLSKDDSSDNSD